MNKINLIAVIFILLLLGACSPHRQAPRWELPTPTKRLHVLKQRLDLTMAQMDAFKPILDEEYCRKTEIMQIMEDGDEDAVQEAKMQMEDLEWDTFKRLSKHLTQEQVDLLSEFLLQEAKKQTPPTPEAREKGGKRGPRH